jgi:hypothetical protein
MKEILMRFIILEVDNQPRIGDIIGLAKEYLNSNSQIKSKEAPEFHKIVQAKDFWIDTTKLKELDFTNNFTRKNH